MVESIQPAQLMPPADAECNHTLCFLSQVHRLSEADKAVGCWLQVVKSTKQAQQRKAKAGGGPSYADDAAAADAPQRWSDYTVHFEFPEPTELPPPLIQLNDVSFQYPGRDDFGLKELNIGVDMGSRVAIVGPNGAGKTTLMNLLAGLPAASGMCVSPRGGPIACDRIRKHVLCLGSWGYI